MERRIESELLDELPADDPRALRSRRDLRRINSLMGNVRIMTDAVRQWVGAQGRGRNIVDLGGGDGTLMLRLAQRLAPDWSETKLVLVDRRGQVSCETRRQFEALSWSVTATEEDAFEWLGRDGGDRVDLMTANLFLHHFSGSALTGLLRLAAERTDGCFIACEPRRSRAALGASRCLGLIGSNPVTRHDGPASVRSGFQGTELSALWPGNGDWQLLERRAGWFTHCFVAQRRPKHQNLDQNDG